MQEKSILFDFLSLVLIKNKDHVSDICLQNRFFHIKYRMFIMQERIKSQS